MPPEQGSNHWVFHRREPGPWDEIPSTRDKSHDAPGLLSRASFSYDAHMSLLLTFIAQGFFTSQALASTPLLNWVDLEPGILVHLAAPVTVTPALRFEKGAKFAVNHSEPLPSIKVQVLRLRHYPCTSEMAEARVEMTILDSGQGFEMEKGCEVTLYHEYREFYRPSLFERDEP